MTFKKSELNVKWKAGSKRLLVTIALVLKAKALMSCPLEVMSFTRSLNEDGNEVELSIPPFPFSPSLVASTNASINSSLSFFTVRSKKGVKVASEIETIKVGESCSSRLQSQENFHSLRPNHIFNELK